jgi:tRNA-dihydrouridine synthase C
MPLKAQMATNLVVAARFRLAAHERISPALPIPIHGNSRQAHESGNGDLLHFLLVPLKRLINAAFFGGSAMHHRKIRFFHRPTAKEGGELTGLGLGKRKKQQAAGVAVDAVNRKELSLQLLLETFFGTGLPGRVGIGDKARGLVDGHEIPVLLDYTQLHREGGISYSRSCRKAPIPVKEAMLPWIKNSHPALVLAPMEGVTDAPMRALATESPAFSHCVTEFLRISHQLLPERCFTRHAPELRSGSRTPGGVPVIFQLLGGDPEKLAASAATAARAGALGIDLNFGCPAPTVNRHDGGATLLKSPERIETIVASVRAAVPNDIPVSAKLRLGWEDPEAIFENAERAARGGAAWIAIHGRTKAQGYAPPADWSRIGKVRRQLGIPVIANGDLWTLADFRRCRDETGCEHFMLGRGALANPHLPAQVAAELGLPARACLPYPSQEEWRELLTRFLEICSALSPNPAYGVSRVKQWLRFAASRQAFPDFDRIKRIDQAETFRSALAQLEFPTVSP